MSMDLKKRRKNAYETIDSRIAQIKFKNNKKIKIINQSNSLYNI